jgi:hypothetical protein
LRDEAVDATLHASKISAVAGRATCDDVVGAVHVSGTAGATHVKLAMPHLENRDDTLRSDGASAELNLDRGGHTLVATATTRMEVDLTRRHLVFSDLKSNFRAEGQRLPKGGVTGALSGLATFDALKEGLQLQLTGRVAESRIKAQLSLAGFAAPVYTFAVDLDQLDMDRYTTSAPAQPDKSASLELSSLANLPASGTVQIGELKTGGVKARNVTLVLKP